MFEEEKITIRTKTRPDVCIRLGKNFVQSGIWPYLDQGRCCWNSNLHPHPSKIHLPNAWGGLLNVQTWNPLLTTSVKRIMVGHVDICARWIHYIQQHSWYDVDMIQQIGCNISNARDANYALTIFGQRKVLGLVGISRGWLYTNNNNKQQKHQWKQGRTYEMGQKLCHIWTKEGARACWY